jgi:allophanate hydrolase subunit 1
VADEINEVDFVDVTKQAVDPELQTLRNDLANMQLIVEQQARSIVQLSQSMQRMIVVNEATKKAFQETMQIVHTLQQQMNLIMTGQKLAS